MSSNVEPFQLRSARASDAPAVAALVTQLGYPTAAAEMRGRLERLLAHPEHSMVVAEAEGEVVGLVAAQLGYALEFDGVYCRINGLVVDAQWRGRGLGTLLMRHLETWCKERGAQSLLLTSGNHRREAHKFYETLGFSATGLRFIKRV
jgi:GNAT superfamily N-acetyltransferase